MSHKPGINYLAGYPETLLSPVRQLLAEGRLGQLLQEKYPSRHEIRSDRALYDYVVECKNRYLGNSGPLHRVAYDSRLHLLQNALGIHSRIAHVQGGKLKRRSEIVISSLFREMPAEFLHMIVVHELAHLRQREHNKAFYQLCQHMAPDYHQLEFDLRCYLLALQGHQDVA